MCLIHQLLFIYVRIQVYLEYNIVILFIFLLCSEEEGHLEEGMLEGGKVCWEMG